LSLSSLCLFSYLRSRSSHSQIYKSVKYVGGLLETVRSSDHYDKKTSQGNTVSADTLIANIEGGHIKARGDGRSFEAMVAKVYRPENLKAVNQNHNTVTSKTIVASAKDDGQAVMKNLFKNACIEQGMTKNTKVTCLADGAENCWSIAHSIDNDCQQVTFILDWFHISMKFKNIAIPDEHKDLYERAKWNVWHGKPGEALVLLKELKSFMKDNGVIVKLNKLATYIENNKDCIINYDARKREGLPFTSHQAETTVNTLINDRQKGKKKMLWSREGAHHVLQIRSSVFSNSWKNDWEKLELQIYKKTA
jgi:hypothetical protein